MAALKLHQGGRPLAKGEPISTRTAEEAAGWLTVFMSGEATDDDRARWSAWRAGSRENNLAWEHIESIVGHLDSVKSKAAYRAMTSYRRGKAVDTATRRKVMQALAWGGVSVAGTWWLARRDRAQNTGITYATATGEQRTVRLGDGSTVTLDTDSAIAVDFDASQRTLRLERGAIYVITAHGSARHPDARPFMVASESGIVRALGTQFSVRTSGRLTTVAVEKSAVAVTPRRNPQLQQLIQAGETAAFTDQDIGRVANVNFQTFSWTRGQIVADDMRLDDLINEVNRYRPGIVRCLPGVASLRVSGDFPVADTDQILASLPRVLPVKITRMTRYWAVVSAR